MASVPNVAFPTSVYENLISVDFAQPRRKAARALVRRKPTAQQGRSLEILGHAIEYLVDGDLRDGSSSACAPHSEAVQILTRVNREVFVECQEIVSLWETIRNRFHRTTQTSAGHTQEAQPANSNLIR